ncbi:MAG: YggS family pyridoxal phosphate-dependent enzyme [Burkholderiaceae bacterium]|nr:YggS family pyridoxal phosphate-dependent enzyme [Burkholderiaceae bacterium]
MILSLPTLPANLQANLQAIHERITKAARAAGREPSSVRLLAVSKTFPPEVIGVAAQAGQRAFGENYVQEAVAKMDELADISPALEWHFIGPIQSNKTRLIAERFNWVQSVDRLKVAERLSEQRPDHLPPLNVLLQVNVSAEASKGGVAPDALAQLAAEVDALPHLCVRGLMAVPAPEDDVAQQRAAFARMRQLFDRLREQSRARGPAGSEVDVLSIGMSSDLEAAIAEGSTMVRIGTAIFGTRQPRQA